MAPKQCGKFHLLSNSVAVSNHSFLEVGALMNPFLSKPFLLPKKVIVQMILCPFESFFKNKFFKKVFHWYCKKAFPLYV